MFVRNINLKTKKMKRKIFSILAIAAIAMTSCSKDEVLDSNQLGEAVIKGNVFANLDLSNDVDGAGLYNVGSMPEKVEGMVVSVEIDTKNWDQSPDNNYAYPKKTYTATTDANGDYTLTIPATEKASNVYVSLGDYYTTQKLYTADGTDLTKEVVVGKNSGQNVSIFSGAALNISTEASVTSVTSASPYEYGSATIRMSFSANWDQGPNSVGFYDDMNGSSLIGKTVEFSYSSNYGINGNGGSNVFTGTIVIDPLDITKALVVVENIPTYSTVSGQSVNMKVSIASFQGVIKQDNGSGVEESNDALWSPANGNSFYFGSITDGQILNVGAYQFNVTPN